MLQCNAACCNVYEQPSKSRCAGVSYYFAPCCSGLQCVAVCCSVLQLLFTADIIMIHEVSFAGLFSCI